MKQQKTLKALSKISGLSKKKIKEIWTSVEENKKLLDSCSLHHFEPHPSHFMSRRFMCKECKGVVGAIEMQWYKKGLGHHNNSDKVCRCSACGNKYEPEAWPSSWRCPNCF